LVIAYALLGQGEQAAALFSLLNPINRTLTRVAIHRYKVEPYVIAADIYSVAPHVGRGGWTWYTGSAGWMYRAGLESILGFQVRADRLHLAPCIPRDWPHYAIDFRYRRTRYQIRVENPQRVAGGVAVLELDGVRLPSGSCDIGLQDDGGTHHVHVVLGTLPDP
jgi:cyclic beta-1,2-glucan synthetase